MRRAILPLLLMSLLTGCGRDRAVWFVQISDPHFFEDIQKEKEKEEARVIREKLSRDAFSDLMRALEAVPGREGKPDLLCAFLPAGTLPAISDSRLRQVRAGGVSGSD